MDLLCTEQIIISDYDIYLDGNRKNDNLLTNNNKNFNKINQDNNNESIELIGANGGSSNNGVNNVGASDANDNGVVALDSSNISYFNEFTYVNTAQVDPTFLTEKCLENLLKSEEKHEINYNYFRTVQREINPSMRKIVVDWMLEVCDDRKCQEEVVLLAINYLDRFLSTTSVRKTHLQMLGAACLLLASKLREPSCRCLSADLLVVYTDNSIYKADLINWELYVLSKLNWDLSTVTPLDFLELLLSRLPISKEKTPHLSREKIRQHAQAFISLATKELYFTMYTASTIAAASIAAAINGPNWHLESGLDLRYLLDLLTDLTGVEQDFLHECMIKLENIYEEHIRSLQPYLITLKAQTVDMKEYNDENNSKLLSITTTQKLHHNNYNDVDDCKKFAQKLSNTHSYEHQQQQDNHHYHHNHHRDREQHQQQQQQQLQQQQKNKTQQNSSIMLHKTNNGSSCANST